MKLEFVLIADVVSLYLKQIITNDSRSVGFPILIVEKKDQKAYFWTDQPCFGCIKFDKCERTKELVSEFKELEVYGY